MSKNFHNKEVLNDINIEIESGKIYGLLDVNASGKTTLIGLINNLLIPTKGEVLLDENADSLREKHDTSIENIFKEVIQNDEVI